MKKLAALSFVLFTGVAQAQAQSSDEAPPPLETIPVETAEPAAPPPPTESKDAVVMETVVVTGELLDREAAQSISSVALHSGEAVERSTARDVYDVIRATPNAALEDSDYGVGGMNLRGIGSYGASGAGAYASYSTTSVVVLDGVGLPRSALAYADLSAFDLANVEIFRGPQSTSQGRNAMAGAVIINSIAPEPMPGFFPQLRGRFAGGEQGFHQVAAAAEATLWPDRLALRLLHDDRADDGDIRNATRGEDDAARRESRSTRARLRLQPDGADGRYSALLSFSDIERYQGSTYVQLENESSRTAVNNSPQDFDNQAQLYTLDQRLRMNESWSLRAVSAWFDSDTLSRFDIDYGADDDGATVQQEDSSGFSQELRLNYSGEHLRSSFGVYYYDEDNRDDTAGTISVTSLLAFAAPGLCTIQLVCSAPLGNVVYESGSPSRVKDMAVFGEIDWSATQRLTLTAGLRVDREENSRVITSTYDGDTATARLLVSLLKGSVFPADGSVPVSREFSEVLPKIAARYEVFDGWFLGAAYAEGYRPGGDGYNQVSGRRFSFDSERTRNTELSFKGSYLPWKLQAALNLFHTRWEDMQIQLGEGIDNYMGNAGPATIRGGELELRWRPFRRLQLLGGYGVTWGRFDDDVVVANGADLSGHRLPKAPKYSGTLALEWNPLRSLLIRPDVVWVGSAAAHADNNPVHQLPAYQLVNLAVRWQLRHVGLFFAGTNLTDETYRKDANNYGTAGHDVVSLGEGRRLIGGVELQF